MKTKNVGLGLSTLVFSLALSTTALAESIGGGKPATTNAASTPTTV